MASAQLYGVRRAPHGVTYGARVTFREFRDPLAERVSHIPAISFSTRSSTERNGSLHNTVR